MCGFRKTPVRQQDIATNLGVTVSAVSMALRNHPRVSSALKEKVQAEAARLNYRPDPVMSALVAYRKQKRVYVRRMVAVALLIPSPDWYQEIFWFKEVYEGIQKRIHALGYEFEVYSYPKDRSEARVLYRKLRNTGVKGILLGPRYGISEPLFPLDDFSVVRLSHSIQDSRLSICSHDHFQGMELACKEAYAKGYRNLAYLYDGELERRLGNRWLASFAVKTMHIGCADLRLKSFEVVGDAEKAPEAICQWLDHLQPDCIIAPMCAMLQAKFLRMEGDFERWKQLGRIVLAKERSSDLSVCGIRQNFYELGSVGVDLLHEQLMEQKAGYPRYPRWVFIPGEWVEATQS